MSSDSRPASRAQQLHEEAIRTLTAGRVDEGMALLKKALAAAEGSPMASSIILNDLGMACWQKGQLTAAEKHYKKAVTLGPMNARALGNYGAFLVEQKRLDEAEPMLKQALAMLPGHYKIQSDYGRLMHRRGRLATAERHYLEAIRLNPEWVNAYCNLGDLLVEMNRHEEAASAYVAALKLRPKNVAAHNGMGKLCVKMKRFDEALDWFNKALALDPALERSWERKLNLLERTHRLEEAEEALKQAKAACPNSLNIGSIEARLLRRAGKLDEAIALLEKLRPAAEQLEKTDPQLLWGILFELAELYDRTDRYDAAFASMARAKAGEANDVKALAYDKDELPLRVGILNDLFTPNLARRPGAAPLAKAPVFLVGFPRSGTTLLDQILSSHPKIRVADEEPAVDKMARDIVDAYAASFPRRKQGNAGHPALAALADLTLEDVQAMRKRFFAEHGAWTENWDGVFIDKLPLNIIHAGLIGRTFPGTKFILALRHPCDAVLSCYLRRFDLNTAMVQFFSLEDAAQFYDAVFRLWEHYNSVLKLDVHAIHYEDVVSDFRPAVGPLLDFLGLAWDDAVLEYDRTAREKAHISTPSYHQVTQKIYTRASGRWLRYRKHMEPVLPILAPWVNKFGYSMDQ